MKHDIGNISAWVKAMDQAQPRSLAFEHFDGTPVQWQAQGREKLQQLLRYAPPKPDSSAKVLEEISFEGYTRTEIQLPTSAFTSTRASLLRPSNAAGKLPAVVALHDHSDYYYHGREKILENVNEPPALTALKETMYQGQAWASCLARRGYVVLAIDAFYFGERRLDIASLSDRACKELGLNPDAYPQEINQRIRMTNDVSHRWEQQVERNLLNAGVTWPGILVHDDRAAIDYLQTLENVDPERIGCCGLSLGGFRSAYLAAMDPRIRCAVSAGWMTSLPSMLDDYLFEHTFMVYVPGMAAFMDMPDAIGLAAPRPLMVQNCLKDPLFPLEGMQKAEQTLRQIYDRMEASDRFDTRYYPNQHQLTKQMQAEAFDWLDRWLK